MPIWLGLICSIASAVVIGVIIERFGMRRLVGQPILSLNIVTLALQAFLDGVVTLFWGDYNYLVYPTFIPPKPVEFLNIFYPFNTSSSFLLLCS
jgi:branched-chain amino acid transport system permease protein